ncbi:hypothetical protein C8A05DRAFT_41727 [Staphylotrichum tortipilum]|uniref:Ubiquitin interaction domain-containing protein n=1 Tax=Staphylotrichum tortipilum TaxID=2831512 RepID=A0AAN6MRU9_9PEZI|nr:hypothetical protein C8A05DRAFT_41727 [Staphylotrichum longicolle]
MASVSAEHVEMVVMVTGFEDRAMITNALQGNHGNVEGVINEYLDDPDKFRHRYGWDESVFSSGREGETAAGTSAGIPAFSIHQPVIYGTEPHSFYGAPSRPPSRVNNRSPMTRLVDATAGEYNTDAPSNRQEEEDHLMRAINESLGASGVQSPPSFPPPPPPQPQQTGITTNNGDSSSVYFGPANRPDYDPNEWAMVPVSSHDKDPDPSLRARQPGAPVLLRCRHDINWKKHRIGALLMIYQQIPAARNALLQWGEPPAQGYGNKSDWWQGQPMPVPGQPDTGWTDDSALSWSDELHRLMAFLEATERAYGTADVLARAKHPNTNELGEPERDFFQNLFESRHRGITPGYSDVFTSPVEVVSVDEGRVYSEESFALLDLSVGKDADGLPPPSIYPVLDRTFFADVRMAQDDPSSLRMAWMPQPSEIFTCRLQADDGLPAPIDIPETLYLDRYMTVHRPQLLELQMDHLKLFKMYDANAQKEAQLVNWTNPQTNKTYDRRVLVKAAVGRCQEKIRRIKNRAFWRKHEQASPEAEDNFYLPDHVGDPSLLPEEADVVAGYETKIRELEADLAEKERIMKEQILPEREQIQRISDKMTSLFTWPSADEKWNPRYKYTLRGVTNEPNTVFQKLRRAPAGESETPPLVDAPAPEEEMWWKISFKTEDSTVEHTPVTFETVLREGCGTGCQPLLVFATDKAMEEENLPLSDALKSFVKLDNRHFKQELTQSSRLGHKRTAGLGDGSQSKRLQRSASMDSLATNHASLGDFDDDMRDAPFDTDSMFGVATPDHMALAPQDESIPDLVEFPAPVGMPVVVPRPSYASVLEMDAGVSPVLAQVSLQDSRSGKNNHLPPAKTPEMQERPNSLMFNRSSSAGAVNGGGPSKGVGTIVEEDEEEPLIDLSDPHNPTPGSGTKVNGA